MSKLKNLLWALLLLPLATPVWGQNDSAADTWRNHTDAVQPKIMVVPFTKEGEDIRTVLEGDVNKRIVLSKIKDAFGKRGHTTVDFTARLKAANTNAVFAGENKSDVKSAIIQMSGADIYVEAEIDVAPTTEYGTKVKVILQAYEVSGGNSLSNTVGSSQSFADVGTVGARAVENCIDEFLNMMQTKFAAIAENGKSVLVTIGFAPDSEYNLSSEVGSNGLLLQDEIEMWMEANAYKNNYHLQGASDTEMLFDDVRIPLKDPKTGNQYNASRFGLSLMHFFRSLGLNIKREVKGNTIFITVQ
jgi:hypothetical protein